MSKISFDTPIDVFIQLIIRDPFFDPLPPNGENFLKLQSFVKKNQSTFSDQQMFNNIVSLLYNKK